MNFVSNEDSAMGLLSAGAIFASRLCAHVAIVRGLPSTGLVDRYGWRNVVNRSWRLSMGAGGLHHLQCRSGRVILLLA